jgi:rod shape-determining protein MreD
VNKLLLSRYIIGALIVIFYQIIIAPRIQISGVHADIALILTVWIGLNHGPKPGLYFGFAAGFLIGMLNPVDLGWACLLLSAAGYITGIVMNKLAIEPIPVKLLVLLIAALAYNFLYLLFTKFGLVLNNFPFVIINTIFSAIYTTVVGAMVFYMVRYRYILRNLF